MRPVIVAGAFPIKNVIKEPIIWAVFAALVFTLCSSPVPSVVTDTNDILCGMKIPAMMILLGIAIGQLRLSDLRSAGLLAIGRLGIGVSVVGLTAISALGATETAAGKIFFLTSMPSAVVAYVIAAQFDRDPQQVAGLVNFSTLLKILYLPVLLWFALAMEST